jgi:hypothetical protein
MPKVQFEQLRAAIAKDGRKALAAELELQKKKLKEAETKARNLEHDFTVEKQLRDTEVEQEKKTATAWKARAAKLDRLVKARTVSNAALRKQGTAVVRELAKSNRNQKKILENNEKLKDKLLARIRALNSKVARDHGGQLEAWKEKILTTSKKAEASITNNGFTHNGFAKGVRRYNAIVKSLATAETEVRQTRDDIKRTANEAIAKKRGEITSLNKKARNAVAALNQKGEENETKIKAVEKVIKSKEDEIQSLQDINLGRRDIAPDIEELEREIEAQKEIIKKYRSAARTNVTKKAKTKIAEGDKTVNRLTALETQFNELGLSAPAPVLGPPAPAPDSDSSWTRSMIYSAGLVGALGTVGTLAVKHRPSMPALPSLWGGNSGTAGGGGAKLTPRGGNGDNGKWPVDESAS